MKFNVKLSLIKLSSGLSKIINFWDMVIKRFEKKTQTLYFNFNVKENFS